ncbi:hypothetical protein FN846DRAFT_1013716 [Sphaerosporella brunnea]|uniref:Uncharacterized protein n=1 Tax=Sphaerosporella brunnea TaxID=1250544 RepID=A0A5J5EXE0_9PEZI|nr:hypothetical protein FN846DRAFT_1013716 [Sphaerosporella brunnea]
MRRPSLHLASRRNVRHSSNGHSPHCNIPLPIPHQHPPRSYDTLDRPPHRWKGYSLAPFDRSDYLRRPKERDGIFYTNQHLTEYRWLIKCHAAQIKDIERVHSKELRLLSRRKSIVLRRCKVRENAVKTKEFEADLDVLRFQQLWEKSLVYCRLQIELHHLRSNCRRKLLGRQELTGPEKQDWNEAFLSEVRREQWETLLQIKAAFAREGETFPTHLRAPFGQSLEAYFSKFGVKFGWYRATVFGVEPIVDGAQTPPEVLPGLAIPASYIWGSEDLTSEENTVCAKAKQGLWKTYDCFVSCWYQATATMHFPTSLPRATGSPAAPLRASDHPPQTVSIHSVHSAPYDGPLPVMSRRPRPISNGRWHRPNAKQLSIVTPPTPVYSYFPPPPTQSNTPSDPRTGFSAGSLPGEVAPRTSGPNSIRSRPTSGSNNNSLPNVDGLGTVRMLPTKAKTKITGFFGKRTGRLEDDPEISPTDAAEFYELKKKRWERRQEEERAAAEASGLKSRNNSRARLAARFLGHRGKTGDIETGLDLDDADHHPFDAARQRLYDQRERKMRRKQPGSVVSDHQNETMSPGEGRRHRIVDSVKRGVHFAASAPKEQFEAYNASREEDKANQDVGSGVESRIGNVVRRFSGQLASNTEEREAGTRSASWASGASVQANPRRDSAQYLNTSSSGSPDELLYVPRAADVDDLIIPPVPLALQRTNALLPSSIEIIPNDQFLDISESAHEAPQAPPRSSYIFPPKPPAPFFRPTLSPVSSRSPAPTSVAAANSPKKSHTVSASPRMQQIEQDFSASSLHLPLPDVAPQPPPSSAQKPPNLTIRNASPTVLTHDTNVLSEESMALSPIMEQPTPASSSRKSSRTSRRASPPSKALSTEKAISPLHAVTGVNPATESPKRPPILSATVEGTDKPRETPTHAPTVISPPPFSEISRPKSPPPHPSPSPLKFGIQTPTQSALDFWREADESLAPSDSASAQLPNRHWKPPPNFWKEADRALDTHKAKSPTMEEWIASLPGLGLGLGTWGASDGSIDWKYFQATRKLQKRRSSNSVKTLRSKKSVQDMIEENMEALEKVIEDLEGSRTRSDEDEGLTPDEAEALEDVVIRPEGEVDNNPPTPVNPSLLHPEYKPPPRPASLSGPILETRRPQSRLGKDVAARLDNMEKYWAEQSVAMGTVLKRMLVVVDNLIIKEREQAQKEARRAEMGWLLESEGVAGEA